MDKINYYFFSPLLCFITVICGGFLMIKLRLYSPKRLFSIFKRTKKSGEGSGISPLSSLSVALAGTLGVGNISGVAVAISLGGAGAVFWMMVSAVFGISLKYSEAYLAVKYGGGAPDYIKKLAGSVPAAVYAVLCVVMSLTSGSFIQINAAASSLHLTYGVPGIVTGAVFAVVCGVIVFGGIKRVSSFTSAVMPLFCAVFAGISLIAVFMRIEEVPGVISRIVTEAFGIKAAAGGISGAVFAAAVRHGMTKGIFSHEAGCGTSAFSHGASNTADPAAQGALGIAEVVCDTLFFGLLTAFVILLSPAGKVSGTYDGTALSVKAFSYFFGASASHIITFLVLFFAAGTVICWAYYGCEAVSFLGAKTKGKRVYLAFYCVSLVVGSVTAPSLMWEFSDLICSVMMFLNCLCLLYGCNEIKSE